MLAVAFTLVGGACTGVMTAAIGAAAASTPTQSPSPVAISAVLSAKTITYPGQVTVTGMVSHQQTGAFVPVQNLAVNIYDRAGAPRPVATAVTDSHGHFSKLLPREAASVRWVLVARGPNVQPATVTLPMKVNLPTLISGFQATLSQFWQVSFHGCLALAAGVPGSVRSLAGLTIQYAPGPGGPWRALGTVPVRGGPGVPSVRCGNGGERFSGTLTARLNYAYYRAVYAGGSDTAGTGYLACASGKALAWKYADRIASFTVSPRVLPPNGMLTITGQLQYFAGTWRNYASQAVYLILRPKGSNTWYYIAVATTNTAGRFSATFADPVTATWSAEFFGNSAHLATLAPAIYVAVT